MKHLPDNEFDQLFRDKLTEADIVPSADLWAKIETRIKPAAPKRVFPLYWMAAACMVLAFTALLVFQKEEKIQLHGMQEQVNLAGQVAAGATADMSGEEERNQTAPEANGATVQANRRFSAASDATIRSGLEATKAGRTAQLASRSGRKTVFATHPEKEASAEIILTKTTNSLQPEEDFTRLAIKQADPKPIDVLAQKAVQDENPIVMAQVTPPAESAFISETASMPERKNIRNVGDLVNYVVDKVDKRDKKLLRFTTDEDDNSSIVGINIGFLRLNKRDR